jgi:hypothetical protein
LRGVLHQADGFYRVVHIAAIGRSALAVAVGGVLVLHQLLNGQGYPTALTRLVLLRLTVESALDSAYLRIQILVHEPKPLLSLSKRPLKQLIVEG